jgi:hypothetical protein
MPRSGAAPRGTTMLASAFDRRTLRLALAALVLVPLDARGGREDPGEKKPSVSLRASPAVAFAPARIFLTAEIRGGADDYEDLYCPTVEWDWGDGTASASQADCAPYESGKSQIRRRYAVEHVYRQAGGFRIQLRLKKGTRVNGFAQAVVQVRAGLP